MSKEFVYLTQLEVEDWADHLFGEDQYQLTTPKRGIELVVLHDLHIQGLEIHVYTTVVPEVDRSRDCGEDAIRFILFDRFSGKVVATERKVLRVEGDTTVFERCSERVNALIALAHMYKENDWFCKRCKGNRPHTIERVNRSNGQKFRGCSLFPNCGQSVTDQLKGLYPLKMKQEVVKTPEVPEVSSSEQYQPPVAVSTPSKEDYLVAASEDDLVPTSRFPTLGYRFQFFNKIQSSLVKSDVIFSDQNLVLGTATSSGKTIAAELAIAAVLKIISQNKGSSHGE